MVKFTKSVMSNSTFESPNKMSKQVQKVVQKKRESKAKLDWIQTRAKEIDNQERDSMILKKITDTNEQIANLMLLR